MNEDLAKKVHETVLEVGTAQVSDKEKLLEGLDHVIELVEKMKRDVESGDAGPLNMKTEQFRNIQPDQGPFGFGAVRGYKQAGPVVTRITVLDYHRAGSKLGKE